MTHCNLTEQCIFFIGRDEDKEIREYFNGLYCAGNFSECARYRAALGMGQELVPEDIFPNEDDFVSLFFWALNLREGQTGKPCRPRCPDRQPVATTKKAPESSDHLPPTRPTRSQR